MKKIIIALSLISFISFSQNITKEDYKKIKTEFKGDLKIEPDFFKNVIWIKTKKIAFMGMTSPSSLGGSTRVHQFYFGVKKDSLGKFYTTMIHYVFNYKASNWIFADKISLIVAPTNDDTRIGIGNRYEIVVSDETPYREVKGDGNIEEEYDIAESVDLVKWIKEIAETGNYTRIRASGSKGYEEFVLRGKDMQESAKSLLDAMNKIPTM